MAINPLDLVTSPDQAPVPQPGFFDGQLPLVQQPDPPGADAVPQEEMQIAGWGKAVGGILNARKILKEHKAKGEVDIEGEAVPFERSTPKEQDPNKIVDSDSDPLTLEQASEIDPSTAKVVETPEGATAAVVSIDAAAVAEATAKYQKFTTDTPFSALDDFNPANLTNEQDILAVIAAHSEVYRKSIDDKTGEVITHEVTRHMADLVGASQGRLIKKLLGGEILHGKKPGEVAANMLAARDLLLASAQESDRLAKLVFSGDVTALAKAGFQTAEEAGVAMERQFALNAAIHAQVKGAQTEIARTLSAHSIPARGAALRQQAIGDVLTKAGGNATPQERAFMYLSMEDPIKQADFLRKTKTAKTFDAFYEAWINALLSSPVTHVVNLVGNMLFGAGQVPIRTMAAMMGHMRRRVTGATDGVHLGEDAALMMGSFFSSWDAVKLAGKAFKDPAGEAVTKMEPGKKYRVNAFSAEALQAGGILGRAIDFAGSMATMGRMSTRLLAAGDVLFKARAQQAHIYAEAFRSATREGITDPTLFAEAVADNIANPSVLVQEGAQDFGRMITFQSTLGEQGKNLQGLASHALIRWFIPFLKTPMNIISRAWDHTPFAMFSQDYRKAIAMGGEHADLARARVAMGTTTMGAVAVAANAGYITGGGPSNIKLRKNLERQGWRPYSIRIGDTYYSFKRVEPFATVMGLAADLVEIGGNAKNQESVATAAAALGMAFSKNVTSKTWMTGMSNLLEAIENPDRYGPKVIEGFIRSMIPRGVAQFERVGDPEHRYVRTLMDAIKQDVPGWSSSLPANLNIWGEPIVYQSGGFITGMINPFYASEFKPNDLDKELDRLKIGFSPPPETIPNTGGQLMFDPWEYHDFAERAGQIAKARIEKVITSREYKDSNDLIKEMRIRRTYDSAKTAAWGWLVTQSKHKDTMIDLMKEVTTDRVKEMTE